VYPEKALAKNNKEKRDKTEKDNNDMSPNPTPP
jgi:hypothetical protein